MKKRISSTCLILLLAIKFLAAQHTQRALFDEQWKFHRGGALSAEKTDFDDALWRTVDLPHDWSIEDLPGSGSPFHPDAISGVSGGFTTGGTGWYRKTFDVSAEQKNKRLIIQFDGVYMNADVWLNGQWLGSHPYGYTSFWFDLTDKIVAGRNVVAVKVKNEGENSRWYSGSGIYRHVWLTELNEVHLVPWTVSITTPVVTDASASVNILATVNNTGHNASDIELRNRIINSQGKEVATSVSTQHVAAGSPQQIRQELAIPSPERWSVDTPVLYRVITEVYRGGQRLDALETTLGLRTIHIDAQQGFLLNGRPLKLKGGCVHHDNGPLGARAYDRAEARRVELLKASGYNAIRCTHNPPSPAFLDACDRLGMLVIDEAFDMWTIAKNPFDYSLYFNTWWQRDVDAMVMRDRNHPSIILWSIGNEIPDMEAPEVVALAKQLAARLHSLDPTRLVTAAVNGLSEKKDPFFSALDVAGYNYAAGGDHGKQSLYAQDHGRVPGRVMYGSESYALEAFSSWMGVRDNVAVIGDFVWTAFDYIGEASIGWRGYWQEQNFYPWNLAYCGDLDICGGKRPQSYYRDALWKDHQLSVFVKAPQPSFEPNPKREAWSKWHWHDVVSSWNWTAKQSLDVVVYSSCETVELFLNGKSLGKKTTNRATEYNAVWQVSFEAGTLQAVGYVGKKKVNTAVLRSAGAATTVKLVVDRAVIAADGQDLSYVTVTLEDAQGIRNPLAENEVNFTVTGPGEIVGVGNANPVSVESYQQPHRKAWQGKCLVVVKSTRNAGAITLTATAAGLASATTTIQTK